MRRVFIALGVLGVLALACGSSTPRRLDLYPTVTTLPTQTPYIIIQTTTPVSLAPVKIQVQTATQTSTPNCFTVQAPTAVYLRPAPNAQNYPITPVGNGVIVVDLGGRDGEWVFVALGAKHGWINKAYLMECK